MIKTRNTYYRAANQPQILSKEKKHAKRKEKNYESVQICLNCTKKKCCGTKECFERMKSNDTKESD